MIKRLPGRAESLMNNGRRLASVACLCIFFAVDFCVLFLAGCAFAMQNIRRCRGGHSHHLVGGTIGFGLERVTG
jgi:phosphate/sulfate permease